MTLEWYSILFIVLACLWSIFIVYYFHKLVNSHLKFLLKTESEEGLPDKYKPFYRYDRKNWKMLEIYFCAIFILPIRIIFIAYLLIQLYLVSSCCICTNKDTAEIEFGKCRRTIFKFFIRFTLRFMLFFSGVLWVSKDIHQISKYDPDYPEQDYLQRLKNQNPTILIANHTAIFDPLFMGSTQYAPSFVAKYMVKQIPIVGGAARLAQCIFVKRESAEQRHSVLEAVVRRGKNITEGKNFPPIALFPEGTTTNGKYLISFKKGAFEPFQPIKMYILKYGDQHFHPYLDTIATGTVYLLSLVQFKTSMQVIELDTYYPDHLNLQREEDWEIYANVCKKIMLKAGSLLDSNASYRDYLQYEKMLKEEKRFMRQQSHRDSEIIHVAGGNDFKNNNQLQILSSGVQIEQIVEVSKEDDNIEQAINEPIQNNLQLQDRDQQKK